MKWTWNDDCPGHKMDYFRVIKLYLYMCVCVCVCLCARVYANTCACMCVCVRVCVRVCVSVCVRGCVRACLLACVRACIKALFTLLYVFIMYYYSKLFFFRYVVNVGRMSLIAGGLNRSPLEVVLAVISAFVWPLLLCGLTC